MMDASVGATAGDRIPWKRILGWFVLSRVLILAIAKLALLGVAKGEHFGGNETLLGSFQRWDASWYMGIARDGYTYIPHAQSSVVFFPFYPALMKLTALVVGSYPLAGMLIANLSLLGACGLLWRIACHELGTVETADHSVALLLLCPVSFFFSCIYSESLFLLCALGCVHLTLRRQWLLAGICGYLAAMTRIVGFLLVIPMLCEWIRHCRAEPRRNFGPLLACALPAAGTLSFFAYLWVRFGDFLLYFHTQVYWYQGLTWPTNTFYNTFHSLAPFYGPWFSFFALVAVTTVALGFKLRLSATHVLTAVGFTAVYISKNHLDSLPRYVAVIYPVYLVEALVLQKWPAAARWIWAVNGMLLCLSVTLFVTGFYFS